MASGDLYVLDASALIAVIGHENGWRVVNKILETGRAVATPIALAETFGTARRKLGMKPGEVGPFLLALGLEIEDLIFDDAAEIAFIQERADAAVKGIGSAKQLSIADAACLAVGSRLGAKVIFSDTFWEVIDLQGIEIVAFR